MQHKREPFKRKPTKTVTKGQPKQANTVVQQQQNKTITTNIMVDQFEFNLQETAFLDYKLLLQRDNKDTAYDIFVMSRHSNAYLSVSKVKNQNPVEKVSHSLGRPSNLNFCLVKRGLTIRERSTPLLGRVPNNQNNDVKRYKQGRPKQ